MPKQIVDVIGRDGHVLHTYTIEVEHADCVDAEYEEIALVHAENGKLVPKREHIHLRARCVK
jgi:hypothetical protein